MDCGTVIHGTFLSLTHLLTRRAFRRLYAIQFEDSTVDPVTPGSTPDGVPPLRVLCVDDNRDVADSEADLLHVHGFDARACYSGASALREAVEFQPCVCLIDLNMPGMDGDELARRLREQEGGPPPVLVAVTARDDEQSRRRMREAGLDPHLVKPVDPNELVAVIDSMKDLCNPS